MFATSIIEVAIGLVFVYLLMSLICSAVNEMIESFLKNRAKDLERGISELFNGVAGDGLVAEFYNHPLIKGLFRGEYGQGTQRPARALDQLKSTNLPSYIPARNFAYAIIDIVLHPATGVRAQALPVSMDAIRPALRKNFGESPVGRALRTLAEQAGDDVNALRENVETWFNGSMDRVSGTYKRRTQRIIFALGFILTVLLNINTITIARRLSTDATMRSVIVAQAEGFASRPDALNTNLKQNKQELEGLGLPLGWQNGIDFINPLYNENFNWWDHTLLPILGWLLTAAAISLGAPFWFDLLNKFMVIRATVKPHEKSLEEGSEDRQAPENKVLITAAGNSPSGTSATGSASGTASTNEFSAIPEPEFSAAPDAEDNESHLDGCDLGGAEETSDDELPPTKGGVA